MALHECSKVQQSIQEGGQKWAHLDSKQEPTGCGPRSSSAMTDCDPHPGQLASA